MLRFSRHLAILMLGMWLPSVTIAATPSIPHTTKYCTPSRMQLPIPISEEKLDSIFEEAKAKNVPSNIIEHAKNTVRNARDSEATFTIFDPVQHERQERKEASIGILVLKKDNRFITMVLPNSPAQRAGLTSGVALTSVDGIAIPTINATSLKKLLQGEADTVVRLGIEQDGKHTTVTIAREKIDMVELDILADKDIPIIRSMFFGSSTFNHVEHVLKEISAKKPDGIIIDLRWNTGGHLDALSAFGNMFISEGKTLFHIDYLEGQSCRYDSEGMSSSLHSTPIVVLVSGETAEGGEAIAGMLREERQAIIMGKKTAGLGKVEEVIAYSTKDSLKYRIGTLKLPSGAVIEKSGIFPDVIVEDNVDTPIDEPIAMARATFRTSPKSRFSKKLTPVPRGVPRPLRRRKE